MFRSQLCKNSRKLLCQFSTSKVYAKRKIEKDVTEMVIKYSEQLSHHGVTYVTVEQGTSIVDLSIRITRLYDPTQLFQPQASKVKLLPASCPIPITDMNKLYAEQFFYDMLLEVSNQYTIRGIAILLHAIPLEVMTSRFCAQAINNIARIEMSRIRRDAFVRSGEKTSELLKTICINILTDRLCRVGEPSDILDTLEVLASIKFFDEAPIFREKLVDQVINDVISGVFSLRHVIKAIHLFARYGDKPEFHYHGKSLWVGLQHNDYLVDHQNIRGLFECIDLVPSAGPYIIAVVESQINPHVDKLQYPDIHKILHTIYTTNVSTLKLRRVISYWINKHIHSLSTDQVQELLIAYTKTGHHDEYMERALERYMKARMHTTRNLNVVIRIGKYIQHHRARNTIILDQISYIIKDQATQLSPRAFTELFTVFGFLNYTPNQQIAFWQSVENFIEQNFDKMYPDDIMKIFLNFIYMGNFTQRFIPKLHSPMFRNQVEQDQDNCKLDYHIYDLAMTLHAPGFPGPTVKLDPKTAAQRIDYDPQVVKMIRQIEPYLAKIIHHMGLKYSSLYQMSEHPPHALYTIDILAYPTYIKDDAHMVDIMRKHPHRFLAILIYLPAHFAGQKLIGEQRMRRRHFGRIGLNIAAIRADRFMEITSYPQQIEAYLLSSLERAERSSRHHRKKQTNKLR